jgi:hypothetical protein
VLGWFARRDKLFYLPAFFVDKVLEWADIPLEFLHVQDFEGSIDPVFYIFLLLANKLGSSHVEFVLRPQLNHGKVFFIFLARLLLF